MVETKHRWSGISGWTGLKIMSEKKGQRLCSLEQHQCETLKIYMYLQQKWEDCILSRVKLPANDIQHYIIPYESNPDMETMIEKTHSSVQIEDPSIPTLECTTPIAATVSTSMDNTYRSYGQH